MNPIEYDILGACLNESAVSDILQSVTVDDFASHEARQIYTAIVDLMAEGVVPDIATIANKDESISRDLIVQIYDDHLIPQNAQWLLDKFRDFVDKNKFKRLGLELSCMPDASAEEMREKIEKSLLTLQTSSAEHVKAPLSRAFNQMEKAYNSNGEITGIPTGIQKIDDELSGLHKTDMVIVAARPSIGKTALALQIVNCACIDNQVPTLFLSLEMTAEQLTSRLSLSRARVSVSKARNGKFFESDWPKMTLAAGEISRSPLFVESCAGASFNAIIAKAKAAKIKHKIELLVVDYLGLVQGEGNEYDRVSDASRRTKILATQLDIPVIAVHQLNRANEKDGKIRRPTMSDLRSTGQLEQDGDVIILLHREKKEPKEDCEIIIEKNRHGETGIIEMFWHGPHNTFHERSLYGNQRRDW